MSHERLLVLEQQMDVLLVQLEYLQRENQALRSAMMGMLVEKISLNIPAPESENMPLQTVKHGQVTRNRDKKIKKLGAHG